ncbi:MAG: ABC transporter substrate-binding protein [Candidatus Bathyarchaeota archaeon]|nr:ABC transporter substrate-binding protein [Candidatus Termiticorpusculum sp.]
MTKKHVIYIIIITLIATASLYIIYNEFYSSGSSHNLFTRNTKPTTITVIDGVGNTVTVQLPIKRVIVMDAGLGETLCGMGAENLIVGRTGDVVLPSSMIDVPLVGENAYYLNVEEVLELEPDIIISGNLITYNEGAYPQLQNAGIPIYIANTNAPEPLTNPIDMTSEQLYNYPTIIDHTCSLMQNLTSIVGHQKEVTAYVNWAQSYNKIVKDRVAALPQDQQVTVFLDWYDYPYNTWGDLGIYQAGGVNIANKQLMYSATLSPEFVVAQNPSVIIELISSSTHDANDFVAVKTDILNQPKLQNVDAVKNGRVYVCDFSARNGPRAIIGYLYWAKCIHPELFTDIDLEDVTQQINKQFFDTPIIGVYCYP